MKKRLVSLLLATTLVCSSVMVTSAAELSVGTGSELCLEVIDKEITEEVKVYTSAPRAADSIGVDDISGMLFTIGNKTVTSIVDRGHDWKLTVPTDITFDGNGIQVSSQSNYDAAGNKLSNIYSKDFMIATSEEGSFSVESYLGNIRNFTNATVRVNFQDTTSTYSVSGKTADADLSAVTVDANALFNSLYKHVEEGTTEGWLIKPGAYLQVGSEKLSYEDGAGDFLIGDGDTDLNEIRSKIRTAFVPSVAANASQITIYLPKGSSFNLVGEKAVLKEDTLIKVNGLNSKLDGNIITKMKSAADSSTREFAQQIFYTINNILASMDGQQKVTINMQLTEAQVSAITPSSTELEMVKGDTLALTYMAAPENALNKRVDWESSDSSVISVENGVLKALKAGEATITLSSVTNPDVKATCKVTVKDSQVVEPPVIPGTEGKDLVEVDTMTGSAGTELPDEVTEQIANTILNMDEGSVPVIEVDSTSQGTAAVLPAIFQAAADSAIETIVIKNGDSRFVFDVSDTSDIDTSIPFNPAANPKLGADESDIVAGAAGDATTAGITLGQEGKLPGTAGLTMNVSDKFQAGNAVYVYKVDKNTGSITAVNGGENQYTVDQYGNVSFQITEGGSYVVMDKKIANSIPVRTVTLSESKLDMKSGESIQLIAVVKPDAAADKAVTWTSSNPKVAEVDAKGNVKAIARGTAVITAKTANGRSAECTVNVLLAAPSVKVVCSGNISIRLSWKKISGAKKYIIYRASKKDGKYKKIAVAEDNYFRDYNVKINKRYYYQVAAYDTVRGTSSDKVYGTARILGTTLKSVKPRVKAAVVSWKKVSGVDGYRIYAKRTNESTFKLVGDTDNTTFRLKIKNLKSRRKYDVRVRAYKVIDGKTYFGTYSKIRRVLVK